MSDQLVAQTATYTTLSRHNSVLSGVRTRSRSNQVSMDVRLRPHGVMHLSLNINTIQRKEVVLTIRSMALIS